MTWTHPIRCSHPRFWVKNSWCEGAATVESSHWRDSSSRRSNIYFQHWKHPQVWRGGSGASDVAGHTACSVASNSDSCILMVSICVWFGCSTDCSGFMLLPTSRSPGFPLIEHPPVPFPEIPYLIKSAWVNFCYFLLEPWQVHSITLVFLCSALSKEGSCYPLTCV